MKAIVLFNKLTINCMCILIATCTNDLIINAKQVNYFEMFMLSLAIECKKNIVEDKLLKNKELKNKLLKLYKDCQKSCKSFSKAAA
ncbi:hypothetical protein FIA58_014480 [Flavobacterium jejuense]|uniref:Secreted protein n=1 Tax=Flavobacterium jejuense TaxID=1544455 RepID=A0ABX0IT69_9FLAO|nr:hypothetical protein [Flavobacterium jejuense]NHN26888.1 hypothetical protein [Flavobacterium jejuense]